MGELDAMINPPQPQPEPEPEVIYVADDGLGSPHLGDPDFNPGYWFNKPLRRR
jgi:hypothetical protein